MKCEAVNNTMWKRCTAERYEEMLGALMPEAWIKNGFLMGEPERTVKCTVTGQHRPAFTAFVRIGSDHYESVTPLTSWEGQDVCPAIVLEKLCKAEA